MGKRMRPGDGVMARTADPGLVAATATAGAALLVFRTGLNPLWALAAGGLVGLLAG